MLDDAGDIVMLKYARQFNTSNKIQFRRKTPARKLELEWELELCKLHFIQTQFV